MANIRVDVNYTIKDGSEIVFRSPVDCSAITGLVVYYAAENGATVSQEFALSDAHGHNVGDIDHLFAENVVVKVILDVTTGMAYVQNADTNAYIERTFIKTVNGVAPDSNGNVTVNASGGNSGASGLSIFYTKNELDYDPDALISPTVLLDKSNVETHGRAMQVGDLVLFQNGTLATVTGMDTTTGKVTCKAVAKLAASGYVRTVNGVAPDENGNVQVSGGGSEGGKDGYSIFHYNGDVTISDTTSTVSIAPSDVSDNGRTIQAGDLIISNNGTVCSAASVFGTVIIVRPLFNIAGNVDLNGYAKEAWVQEHFQPKGNYLTQAPVQSVNGKTGAVNLDAAAVGADPAGTASTTLSGHNTSADAHNDLRLQIQEIKAQLSAFLDVDEETLNELSELIAAISANKSSVEALTTSKVSVADIVDNLTTNVSSKPLSAAQGVALKGLIDSLSTSLSNYQPKGDYALNSAIPTKTSQLQNDAGYLTKHQDISGLAAKFDPTVYGLPVLHLAGDTAPIAVSKDNEVTLNYAYGEHSGTCKLKGQGSSSYKMAKAFIEAGKAGKFNYTIKFDNPFEAVEGWGAQKKYCLKANWIDPTHSRNICSCKLWGMSVKSRSSVHTELKNLPNGGAIDGFPIVIMLNGEFHGLYTWNIPKDGWMFGMVEDVTKTQAIVCAKDHTDATKFKEASMDGFEVEFVSDEDNADWVEQSLTRAISAVMNSDGSDLDTTVAQYFDWKSAIDYYIHVVVEKSDDGVDKNYLLATYDGVKWFLSAYDKDTIWCLNWDASGTTRPISNVSFQECAAAMRVFELIFRFKTNELKARYKELRGNILSESRIMQTYENFAWAIPSPVKLEDVKLYPTILGSAVNTIDQIGRAVRMRLEQVDKWCDALPAQETPGGSVAPATYAVTNKLNGCKSSNTAATVTEGATYSATITANDGYTLDGATVSVTMGGTDITASAYSNGTISIANVTGAVMITVSAVKVASGYTNRVLGSLDTDGSVFNGTGYKDNVRLSSSGGVSSSPQNGSATTGFMEYTYEYPFILRMKGATWLGESEKYTSTHWYLNVYDAEKVFRAGFSSSALTSSGEGGGFGTSAKVSYDSDTGVTTFDFTRSHDNITTEMAQWIKNGRFIRINAKGNGKDMIVTFNEEIT